MCSMFVDTLHMHITEMEMNMECPGITFSSTDQQRLVTNPNLSQISRKAERPFYMQGHHRECINFFLHNFSRELTLYIADTGLHPQNGGT